MVSPALASKVALGFLTLSFALWAVMLGALISVQATCGLPVYPEEVIVHNQKCSITFRHKLEPSKGVGCPRRSHLAALSSSRNEACVGSVFSTPCRHSAQAGSWMPLSGPGNTRHLLPTVQRKAAAGLSIPHAGSNRCMSLKR